MTKKRAAKRIRVKTVRWPVRTRFQEQKALQLWCVNQMLPEDRQWGEKQIKEWATRRVWGYWE